jgi:hypothetical protein
MPLRNAGPPAGGGEGGGEADVQWAGHLRDDVEAAEVDEVGITVEDERSGERPVRRARRRAGRPARRREPGRLVRQGRRAKAGLDPAGCR